MLDELRVCYSASFSMRLEELDANHVLKSELPRHAPDLPPVPLSLPLFPSSITAEMQSCGNSNVAPVLN